jgi:hypothetical protein
VKRDKEDIIKKSDCITAFVDSLCNVFADISLAAAAAFTDNAYLERVPCQYCNKPFKPGEMNRHVNSAHCQLPLKQ